MSNCEFYFHLINYTYAFRKKITCRQYKLHLGNTTKNALLYFLAKIFGQFTFVALRLIKKKRLIIGAAQNNFLKEENEIQ